MERISDLASTTLLVVVLTGALNTVRVLADRAAAGAHGLSVLLLVKFLAVVVAAALGGYNRFWTLARLRTLDDTRTAVALWRRVLRPVLRLETGVLLTAFALAAAVATGMDQN